MSNPDMAFALNFIEDKRAQGTTPEDLATQGRANASGALKGMFPSIEQENIDEFVENDFTEFMYGLSKGFSNLPFSEEASDFLKLEIDQSKANPDFNKNAEEMFKAFRAESEGLISPARAGELFSNIVWVLPVLQGTAGGFTRLKEATKKITSAVKEKGFDSVLRILNNTIKNKGVKESVNMIFSKNNNKNINTKIADNALKTMEKSLTPTKPTSQQIRQENFSARQASVKRNKETAMQRRREAEEAKALRQQQQEKPIKKIQKQETENTIRIAKEKAAKRIADQNFRRAKADTARAKPIQGKRPLANTTAKAKGLSQAERIKRANTQRNLKELLKKQTGY